jgi:glycosyltransferase involved in cell wall biosynthesis
MYREKSIAVVVPCHNEELLIKRVLETMPAYVDRVYVVDDCSTDQTSAIVESYIAQSNTNMVTLLKHEVNQGVGGAITTGYRQALEDGVEVIGVMAGDAQMDPEDLRLLVDPIVNGDADYTKGNRLVSGEAWYQIPRVRYLGNVMLSLMTKIASGYWHLFDSQTGFTAISRSAAQKIKWEKLWKGYGYPNHLLILLNIENCRVRDVPVKPVYNIGEKSGIRIWWVIPMISLLLFRGFWRRLFEKYVVRDAHPMVLFYTFGILSFLPGVILGVYLVIYRLLLGRTVAATSALFAMFLVMFGLNFIMFALWFDKADNEHLR